MFYNWDEISKICARKYSAVPLKTTEGEEVQLQKKHLYMIIKETYAMLSSKKKKPNMQIGSSEFVMLMQVEVKFGSMTWSNIYLLLITCNYCCFGCNSFSTFLTFPKYESYLFNKCQNTYCGFSNACLISDNTLVTKDVTLMRLEEING